MARTILDFPVQNAEAAYQFAVQTIISEGYEASQEQEC